MRSTNSSPQRRALHERTPSHTNECSPPASVRAVSDKHPDQDERNVYTATPYPTKPEQILPPRPGKGHEFVPDSRFHVDEEPSISTETYSTDVSQIADSSLIDNSTTDPWDLSSTFDAANTPPQLWEDEPSSSKTSFPDSELLAKEVNQGDRSPAIYSDEESTLPLSAPTIKTVPAESISRQPSGSVNASSNNSSPNVVPIGPPSSPNYVALDNSSLNFVRIGTSSNQDSASRSNSLSSLNSLGTVIRYAGAAPWTHGSSSELAASRSHSFRSSPPYQVPSIRSNSTRPSVRSHSRSATSSSGSAPRSDIQQAVVDSGVFIQYPTIRAPSSSGSRVDDASDIEGPPDGNLPEPSGVYSSDRFRSHLSTVSSRWSAEGDSRFPSPTNDDSINTSSEPSPPPAALTRQRLTSSSLWLVNDSDEGDEFLDSVASLPPRPTNPGVPNSQSSSSRSSSVRSNKRPGTSSSFAANFLPTWARMYYTTEEEAGNSTVSLVEESARSAPERPLTSNSNIIQRFTSVVSRARTFTNETQVTQTSEKSQPVTDPRDPRNHWVKAPEASVTRSGSSLHRLRHSWSPHLYPDKRVVAPKSSVWRAPSLDSRTEPILGRRNIQVWSFCLGFICPLTWLIASFLPLPRKPEMLMEENQGPELEVTLKARLCDLERRRYLNARWWRNLNRWMNPLGLVIITIIITLAIVGTTVGF
ncbi:hypothetical protein BJY04DRAFT_197615 [Aspergillus karnatakaensis]|uniref:putative serine-rich protein n=1 Tax=Aspergillus karnatakaensis TaxID=1810916 RepID=UPI003CCE08B4